MLLHGVGIVLSVTSDASAAMAARDKHRSHYVRPWFLNLDISREGDGWDLDKSSSLGLAYLALEGIETERKE